MKWAGTIEYKIGGMYNGEISGSKDGIKSNECMNDDDDANPDE